ncbi:hypothetical protein ScPMuIL_011701 [Solemya velum]
MYLLVVTDEYSRYVIVDILESTSARSVIPHLDKIFAEFGIPHSLKTENGPPFNSFDFATYASHTGFKHRKITPLWPHANAETERFMRTVKKTIKAAEAQQQNWKQEMYKFLLDYRSTPHSTTDVPPAAAFFGRNLRNRLPELPVKNPDVDAFRYRDEQAKLKMKLYADSKAYIKPSTIQVGDPVLVRDPGLSKSKTPYNPVPLTVVEKKGSMVTAKRGNQRVTRNSSFFKPAPRHPSDAETEDRDTIISKRFDDLLVTSRNFSHGKELFCTLFWSLKNKHKTNPGNLGLKRKLEEQTSKTKDVKKRQKSTTTTEGGPSGGGEEAPSCSWQGDTSHVQPGVMRGACNVIENVQTGGNIDTMQTIDAGSSTLYEASISVQGGHGEMHHGIPAVALMKGNAGKTKLETALQ